ncbi:MAG TPA: hypothetical protein VJY39_15700 [Acidisphaera sp.]|nr:hypothetical protein [Acidisphaera sp.]
MTVITAWLTIAADGSVSVGASIPAGEYVARIDVPDVPPEQPTAPALDLRAFPSLDLGPWPERLSLRREDLYGDDGR